MSKVVVFLAPGFEEIEALSPVDYLRRAGVEVVTVSVPSVDSTEITSVVTGAHGISVISDQVLKDFSEETEESLPDAIYFPGGMPGASNLASCDYLLDLIQLMEESGKIVAAMCASPAVVLSKSGILKNRKWTCYPKMNENLATYCGSQEKANEFTSGSQHIENVPFVFDKNVLTGRGPGTAEQFSMEFVRILVGEEIAKKVHDGSCQR